MKPSSQLISTWFGYVVSTPDSEPFKGVGSHPQSTAAQENGKTTDKDVFCTFFYFPDKVFIYKLFCHQGRPKASFLHVYLVTLIELPRES